MKFKHILYRILCTSGAYALYGLLFFIPISNSFSEVCVIAIIATFVGRKLIRPEFSSIDKRTFFLLALFFIFCAASLFNSGQSIEKSVRALFGKWAEYILMCIALQDEIYDRRILKNASRIFLVGAALVVFSGLSQYILGVEFLRGRKMTLMIDGKSFAVTSSFVHYNSLGAYLIAVMSILGESVIHSGRRFGVLVSQVFYALAFTVMILTFSRGSWFAFTCSMIFMTAIAKKVGNWLVPAMLVAVALLLLPDFGDRLKMVLRPGGDSDRFRYWAGAISMIRAHPFLGTGVGTFMSNFAEYRVSVKEAYVHNCYLQIWAETGVFSLLCFLSFALHFIMRGIKSFMASGDFLLLGILSACVGLLVHSFFEVNLYSEQLSMLFWAFAGFVIAISRQSQRAGAHA